MEMDASLQPRGLASVAADRSQRGEAAGAARSNLVRRGRACDWHWIAINLSSALRNSAVNFSSPFFQGTGDR
jgi:hypothetical protein